MRIHKFADSDPRDPQLLENFHDALALGARVVSPEIPGNFRKISGMILQQIFYHYKVQTFRITVHVLTTSRSRAFTAPVEI